MVFTDFEEISIKLFLESTRIVFQKKKKKKTDGQFS